MARRQNLAELINHLGLVRLRIQGSGTLETRVYDYSEMTSQQLVDLTLVNPNNVIPTLLANFESQKMQIEIRVTEENEWFRLRNIIPFTKPTASSYPQ